MNLTKTIIMLCSIFLLGACVNNKNVKLESVKEKKLYSSIGFALIYDDSLYGLGGIDRKLNSNQIVDNKLNNEQIIAMHSSLKKNTLIRIVNPENSNVVETKIVENTWSYQLEIMTCQKPWSPCVNLHRLLGIQTILL